MTISELEKFYQLGNIEGLAFVNNDGLLIEDQMVLSSVAAQVVARSFHTIHKGLNEAGRPCRGFLLKLTEHQFVSVGVKAGFLILQLNPSQPINQFFEQAVTMASYQESNPAGGVPQPSATTPATPELLPHPQPQGAAVPAAATSTPAFDEGLALTWQDFQAGLHRALSRVAPSNLVKKLQEDATDAVGILPDAIPTLEQMKAIGTHAVGLVPNKGRRKMVEKELSIVFQNLGL